jgi:hypothetical protein
MYGWSSSLEIHHKIGTPKKKKTKKKTHTFLKLKKREKRN